MDNIMANEKSDWLRRMREAGVSRPRAAGPKETLKNAPTALLPGGIAYVSGLPGTYRYRDKGKRRKYMRDLMRARRKRVGG